MSLPCHTTLSIRTIPKHNLCSRLLMGRTLDAWTGLDGRVKPLMAGFMSGALFRSTKGIKAAGISGTLVMGVAAGWITVKPYLMNSRD